MLNPASQSLSDASSGIPRAMIVGGGVGAGPERFRHDASLYDDCRQAHDNLANFRARRARSRNYYRGRQWDDTMKGPNGETITEKEWIESQNRLPAINQQIAPVVRNLKGQLAMNKSDPEPFPVDRDDQAGAKMMSAALRGIYRTNRMERVEPAQFEELIISGAEVYHVSYQHMARVGRQDVAIDPVAPDRLFFNDDIRDVRMDGLCLVGELHDLRPDEVISWFAKTPREGEELRERMFANSNGANVGMTPAGFGRTDSLTFHTAVDPHQARVIEAWRAEYAWRYDVTDTQTGKTSSYNSEAEAQKHVEESYAGTFEQAIDYGLDVQQADAIAEQMSPTAAPDYRAAWKCYFMLGDGTIIFEGDSPYVGAAQPYVIGFAVRIDGETWGLVEDLIDAQRMTNRVSSAIDHMFGTGSKGPLVYDKAGLHGTETTEAEVAQKWTSFGGTIAVDTSDLEPGNPAKGNVANLFKQFDPVQVPTWVLNWMELWTERIKQTSGVQNAQLGGAASSGTPASLYQMQLIQSTTNVRDYFETHFETRREVSRKAMQLVAQYYDTPRQVTLGSGVQPVVFDPSQILTLDWDIAAADVTDTAVGWQLWEDDLKEFLGAGHLSFGEYLQSSGNPQSEALLTLISQRAPLMLGADAGPIVNDMTAQAAANGSPSL